MPCIKGIDTIEVLEDKRLSSLFNELLDKFEGDKDQAYFALLTSQTKEFSEYSKEASVERILSYLSSKKKATKFQRATSFPELIEKMKEKLQHQKAIYKRRDNSKPLVEQITKLEAELEDPESLEGIFHFIEDSSKYLAQAEARFKSLKELMSTSEEGLSREEISKKRSTSLAMLHEIKEFLSSYDVLGDIVGLTSSLGSSNLELMHRTAVDSMSRRQTLLAQFETVGKAAIVDWLYEVVSPVNEKLKTNGKEHLIVTKEKIAQEITMMSRDIGFFEEWLGSAIGSSDMVTALVARATSEVLEQGREEAYHLRLDLLDEYEKQTGNKDRPEQFNSQFLHKVDNYELVPVLNDKGEPELTEDGLPKMKMGYKKRWAFIEERDTAAFLKSWRSLLADKEEDLKRYTPGSEMYAFMEARWRARVGNWFRESIVVKPNFREIIDEKKRTMSDSEFSRWFETNTRKQPYVIYENGMSSFDYIEERGHNLGAVRDADGNLDFMYTINAFGELAEPSEKFKPDAWDTVKDNPYYQKLYKAHKEANDSLPHHVRLRHGIIAQTRKSGMDRVLERGFSAEQGKTIKEQFKNATQFQDTDTIYGLRQQDGSPYKTIPVHYTQLLDESELSLDLLEATLKFTESARRYKSLHAIEPHISIVQDLLKTREAVETNALGIQKLNAVTGKLLPKTDVVRANGRLQAFIDTIFYGEQEIKSKANLFGKEISLNKVGSSLSYLTALSSMAFNLISATTNSTFGNFQAASAAVGRKHYNMKDWRKASWTYTSNLPKIAADSVARTPQNKVSILAQLYDAVQGEFLDEYGQKISGGFLKRLAKGSALFFLNSGAEHQIQVTAMIAKMNATQVKYEDGSTTSLYEAYEVVNGRPVLKKGAIWTSEQKFTFTKELHGLNKELHGIYNSFDKPVIQRYWIGKLVIMFRKHIYSSIVRRWGAKRVNYELGDEIQGYYAAFFNQLHKDWKDYRFNILMYNKNRSPEVKAAARQVLLDMVFFTMANMLILAMRDDDEEEGLIANHIILQSRRFSADIFSTANPFSPDMVRLLANPSVTMNTSLRIGQFLWQLTSPLEEYDRKTGVWDRGDSKLKAKFLRVVPIVRQMINLATPEEQNKIYSK